MNNTPNVTIVLTEQQQNLLIDAVDFAVGVGGDENIFTAPEISQLRLVHRQIIEAIEARVGMRSGLEST